MPGDHYQALGVRPTAGHREVRAAYLRRMREHHPDRRPGNPGSTATARRLNAAYEVLGDRTKRAAYDQLRVERPAGTTVSAAFVAERHPTAAVAHLRARPRPSAYSPERATYRQSFSVACLRMALAVMALGVVLLLTFGPQ
jgi:curved DNA-binding protein CbpA